MSRKIVVTRTFTYDVDRVIEDWASMNDGIRPTEEEALELVEEWAYEDMRSPASRHDIVFTDESGEPVLLS